MAIPQQAVVTGGQEHQRPRARARQRDRDFADDVFFADAGGHRLQDAAGRAPDVRAEQAVACQLFGLERGTQP